MIPRLGRRHYGPLLRVSVASATFLPLVVLLMLPFIFKETFFLLLGVLSFVYIIINLAFFAYLELSL